MAKCAIHRGYWCTRRRHNELREYWFGLLEKFHDREGHSLVAKDHNEDGFNLGKWVSVQRGIKDKLNSQQLQRLNDIGFVWNVLEHQWEQGFAALKKFYDRESHCLVPIEHKEDGFRLGGWVCKQRQNKDGLDFLASASRDLGFVWNNEHQWEQGFAALKKFYDREGMPLSQKTTMKMGLGLVMGL